ncbi:MAG: flagellin lysine-N-methylase [Acutalibacteraceae bacterium]|nr:flagellin lysine-N-methylase [Acutalibacteraceae bacterium]
MTLEPVYYKNFKCKANRCKDNCCIGWEIDIDENTYNYYQKIEGDFSERLKNGIQTNDNIHSFKLDKKERCVFLNKNNLCDIIINLGKDRLCDICNNHPRYINSYENLTEWGIGIACEEACRIILTQNEPVYFIDCSNGERYAENPFEKDSYFAYLFEIRNIIINILQNRNYNINKRLMAVITVCEKVQSECDSEKTNKELFENLKAIKILSDNFLIEDKEIPVENKDIKYQQLITQIINSYLNNEILESSWSELLKNLAKWVSNKSNEQLFTLHKTFKNEVKPELIFENLLVYLTYRYFLESCYDDMIIEKAMFLFSSYVIINEILVYIFFENRSININEIIDIVHNYSKEVEYSDVNINLLNQCYHTYNVYSTENISNLLNTFAF